MSTRFATVLLLSLFVSLPCQAQDKQQQNGGYISNKGDALQRLEKFRGDQSRDNLQYHRDKQNNSNSGVGMRFGLQQGMAPGPSSYYRNRPGYNQRQNQNQNNQKNQSQSLAPSPLMTRPIPEQSGPPPGQNFRRPDGKSALHNPGAPGETMADKLKVLKGMQAQRAAQWAKEKNIKSSELGIPGQQ